MYTLRTINRKKTSHQSDDGRQGGVSTETLIRNQSIGNSYNYIDREMAYGEFCKAFEKVFDRKHVADSDESSNEDTKNCVGFIVCNDGQEIVPVYKNEEYYVMTGSGETFEKI